MAEGTGRAGRRASRVLAVVGAVLLLVGVYFLYAARELFDADSFAGSAAEAVEDERVRAPIAEAIVDAMIENAEPDLVNARPVLISVTSNILGTGAFELVFREAAERAHKALFTRDGENLVLNLADGATLAIDGLRAVSPKLAAEIPDGTTAKLNRIVESQLALELAKSAEEVRVLGYVLPVLALLLLAGAVAADPQRRRGFLTATASVAIAAGAGLALLLVARTIVLARLDTDLQDAGAAVWGAFLGDLATWFFVLLGAALLLAAAVNTRRQLDPAEPLRKLSSLTARPEGTAGQVLRALAVLAIGVLILVSPEGFLRLFAIAVGAYATFYALSELLILIAPPPPPGAAGERPLHRRISLGRLAAGVAVIVVVAVVVAIVGRDDGPSGPRARAAASIERCNGFAQLCDRRLSEVAFPSVHNAMSAANDDFLIANNQRPIPDQLDAGVRGLLIDAHYGRRGDGGQVVTDLEKEGQTRQQIADAVGEDFVRTAERLVGRITGTKGSGKSEPYFCHVFCELGAIPMADELVRIRKFLETHPDEVLVVFIEDYVKPADIAAEFEEAKLVDYAWTQRRGEPLPTLREMIASGRRLFVMAENEGGGEEYPWYAQGFDLAQETPYTFHSIEELADPKSCDPNRGSAQNPLFQVNHWVEAIPRSPKTAAKVNAFKFLYRRAKRCDADRELLANLVAVDFWEQGDLFEVTRKLNGLGRDAEPRYAETG
ncbi:MAG TPA: hypothetical protein VFY99_10815 [Solirubrobacterales bacterium]